MSLQEWMLLHQPMTSNIGPDKAPSVEAMAQAIERIAREPIFIGTLMGFNVYASRAVADGTVLIVDPVTKEEKIRFRVDHPLLNGTSLQETARKALNSR